MQLLSDYPFLDAYNYLIKMKNIKTFSMSHLIEMIGLAQKNDTVKYIVDAGNNLIAMVLWTEYPAKKMLHINQMKVSCREARQKIADMFIDKYIPLGWTISYFRDGRTITSHQTEKFLKLFRKI